ncbi:hypothetical protein PAGA_a1012 [Pseudoalteromonas agarivorans DSM 14585]|uniref:Uncharacterized protein n=1 Tax=Pseudoalteromonas agarivorans DSM 14585 TaxID=1312369 RepID=A0ACA8DTS1_9GAMM|nr:hypothetical protein PAGA_a1012 [Pseudoalteromonas agarivorans DSM 14585]
MQHKYVVNLGKSERYFNSQSTLSKSRVLRPIALLYQLA